MRYTYIRVAIMVWSYVEDGFDMVYAIHIIDLRCHSNLTGMKWLFRCFSSITQLHTIQLMINENRSRCTTQWCYYIINYSNHEQQQHKQKKNRLKNLPSSLKVSVPFTWTMGCLAHIIVVQSRPTNYSKCTKNKYRYATSCQIYIYRHILFIRSHWQTG